MEDVLSFLLAVGGFVGGFAIGTLAMKTIRRMVEGDKR